MSMNYSPESIQYTIQAGDSLGNIAYQFNTTAEEIVEANPGIIPATLGVGQVILIPTDFPINAEQFGRFGRPFFRGPFGYGRFGRPFFGPGWGWGYGPSWGGPWWY